VKKGHKCFFVGRVSSFLVNSPPTRPISCPTIFTILPQNQNVKFHFACIYLFHYYFSVSTSSDFYDIFQVSSSFFFFKKKRTSMHLQFVHQKWRDWVWLPLESDENPIKCIAIIKAQLYSFPWLKLAVFLTNKDRAFYCSLKYSAKLNAMVLLQTANRDYSKKTLYDCIFYSISDFEHFVLIIK